MKAHRDKVGRFARRGVKAGIIIGACVVFGSSLVLGYQGMIVEELVFTRVDAAVVPVAEAETVSISVDEMKERLDEIVWGGESKKKVMKEGEILQTFDPNSAEYQECIRKGGRMPSYCISNGPRQIKLSMIQAYWPQVYDGEKISDLKAIEVMNSNEGSKQFFLDCAIKVEGCVWRWEAAKKHADEVEFLIKWIRKAQ
jgi:hypothetical protein